MIPEAEPVLYMMGSVSDAGVTMPHVGAELEHLIYCKTVGNREGSMWEVD